MSFIDLISTILVTLVTLGILITIHEYGHYWVARKCGVRVLRFSIGFGKPFYIWKNKEGTEFALASIPLGGYVRMVDEREGDVPEEWLPEAFTQKPVMQRIAIVLAGPLANLILAVFVYWLVFLGGEAGPVAIVDKVNENSIAAKAGVQSGDEIVSVDGEQTPTMRSLNYALLKRIGESGDITIETRQRGYDFVNSRKLQINDWLADAEQPDLVGNLGIELYYPPIIPLINEVVVASPAEKAGLRTGDLLLEVDGMQLEDWMQWVDYVRQRQGQSMQVLIDRDGQRIAKTITPETIQLDSGEKIGRVGVSVTIPEWPEDLIRRYDYGIAGSLVRGFQETINMSLFTLDSIKKMLLGLISPKNLSGPITIAKVASDSAKSGLVAWLSFLALLSVSLGVLNLLPIPVLDGGHLVFYFIELIKGSPVSEQVQELGFKIGSTMVLAIMVLAIFNDFARL